MKRNWKLGPLLLAAALLGCSEDDAKEKVNLDNDPSAVAVAVAALMSDGRDSLALSTGGLGALVDVSGDVCTGGSGSADETTVGSVTTLVLTDCVIEIGSAEGTVNGTIAFDQSVAGQVSVEITDGEVSSDDVPCLDGDFTFATTTPVVLCPIAGEIEVDGDDIDATTVTFNADKTVDVGDETFDDCEDVDCG